MGLPEVTLEQLRPLREAAESRSARFRPVEVIEYTPERDEAVHLALPGSMTFYFARAGSPLLAEIRRVAMGEMGGEEELARRIRASYEGRNRRSISEAIQMAVAEPVFAELRYGGLTLAEHLFLPDDVEIGALTFPYNGGRLALEGFKLVEYCTDESASLDGVVLRLAPPMTKVERAVLERLSIDRLEMNVGRSVDCDWTTAAVAVTAAVLTTAVAVRVVLAGTALCLTAHEPRISEDEILQLGPEASARRLLALRREALERNLS